MVRIYRRTTSPCPVAHQRQKSGGRSLHFLPSRAAPPTRRARPAHAGPHPTALYHRGHGQSVPTRLQCGLPGTALTTTARALPSDSAVLQWSKSCTTCLHIATL